MFQPISGPPDLADEIDGNLVTCVDRLGKGTFLPEDQITCLATRENIKMVLEAFHVRTNNSLVEFIFNRSKRVFLALFCIRNVPAILTLKDGGFCDEHLPLVLDRNASEKNRRIARSLDEKAKKGAKHWKCFSDWETHILDSFQDKQWMFLAPTFRQEALYQRLDPSRPLPFIGMNEASTRKGRFSTVYQVKIHGAHLDNSSSREAVIAVKSFKDNEEEYFEKELKILNDIRDLENDHLIKPLAAFENGVHQCVLFPWCDGGNLRDYWQRTDDTRDEALISWTLAQMAGLCGCLKWLWNRNCRHGDLKPENILHKGGKENFLIADVGISKIHYEMTEKRNKSTSTKFASYRYEPPEVTMNRGNHKGLSRDYDTWSMGSILLEWLVWLLNYSDGQQTLNRVDRFWQKESGKAQVDPDARELMQEMRRRMEMDPTDNPLRSLLDLVQKRLLVVELAEGQGPRESYRAKAMELSDRMNIIARCPSYKLDPMIWETTGTTRELPERLHQNSGNIPTMGDITDNAPNQQQRRLRPDRYDKIGRQLDDVWKSQPDDDFARRILKRSECVLSKTPSPRATLCSTCKNMDISSDDSQIPYDMSNLRTKSGTCSLCAFLYQCLLDNGIENTQVGRLTHEHSTLAEEDTKSPIISIYRDFEPQLNTLHTAQLGLPQLPKPGSPEQLSLLNEWLSNCDQTHNCQPPPPSPSSGSQMPTRLLDVGSGSTQVLRLVDTEGQMDSTYIALSHCWGNVPEKSRFCTNRSNIERHKESIDVDMLPKTFRDAVTITRGLGIQYLWIDSLCIIQQDMDDWGVNAGKMETVFSSAYCTIAASSACSYLDGFIHHRDDRPSVTVQIGDRKLHFCKYVDNFHRDVEEAALNKRGWVLQERALSRRTIHFTSNQLYLECGDGVRCETLARLRNSKAEFLGDPNFPNTALQYFRDGRIVLFQTLYGMYSRLAFTVPTDRSMGIIGLERRLARTFRTQGDYGILKLYLARSLIWKRECNDKLRPITYPEGCTVPSWSWMACSGEISYVAAPFGGVQWNDEVHISFEDDGRLRNPTQTHAGKPEPEIEAPAKDINMSDYTEEILERLVLDEITVDDPSTLRCVVLGRDKEGDEDKLSHYVIVIKFSSVERPRNIYRRVGAGSLLARHISAGTGERVSIR
ncbi:HET-domain-containing protein [Hypoxylon crocopeplum]|nr:HET-domain-containing protein [Hypoxylon crocopeplum]